MVRRPRQLARPALPTSLREATRAGATPGGRRCGPAGRRAKYGGGMSLSLVVAIAESIQGLWRTRTADSRAKYGFRASGVRTSANADRAETGRLPGLLSSVLNRPSQQVRRDLASGERFPAVAARGRSAGPPGKPQETCHSARRSVRRRARRVWELAEGVRLDSNRRRPLPGERDARTR
jgi:hypothetical protein